MREQGTVISIGGDGSSCWVETQQKSTCGGCAAKMGCGQSLLTRLHEGRKNVINVALFQPMRGSNKADSNKSYCQVSVGDMVEFSVPDNAVLLASAIVYLLPLLCMMLAVVVGSYLGWSEGVLILISCLSLGVGFFGAKRTSAQPCTEPFIPVFQRRVTSVDELSVVDDFKSLPISSPGLARRSSMRLARKS